MQEYIPGLYYIPNIIPLELSNSIQTELNTSNAWFPVGGDNSRKVIHYGFKYNYKTGNVSEPAAPFPQFANELVDIIRNLEVVPNAMALDQCLINKYEPGQGISAHTDSINYDDFICCFTLGSGAYMEFTRNGYTPSKIYTEPNSLYIISGASRYLWKHEMRGLKTDTVDGKKIKRGVRTSITFRSVKRVFLETKNTVE
jgi:alkylated DNA repair dioxygenase AlkB